MVFRKRDSTPPKPAEEEKTLLVGPPASQRRLAWPARDDATEFVVHAGAVKDEDRDGRQDARGAADDDRTRIVDAPRGGEGEPVCGHGAVVGWLVVVSGPGRGRSIEIVPGMNSIGRGAGQRIRVDFGDDLISRENHAAIAFDVRSGRFFLTQGGGKNLTYLDGEPVLAPVELQGNEIVSLGDTELRFVRFCGPDFSWA